MNIPYTCGCKGGVFLSSLIEDIVPEMLRLRYKISKSRYNWSLYQSQSDRT